jgi:hypothetical protein
VALIAIALVGASPAFEMVKLRSVLDRPTATEANARLVVDPEVKLAALPVPDTATPPPFPGVAAKSMVPLRAPDCLGEKFTRTKQDVFPARAVLSETQSPGSPD